VRRPHRALCQTKSSSGIGAESDRSRWDRKYAAGEGPAHFEPNRLLTENRHLLTGGKALDAACGFGGNALHLVSLGYRVDAIDISGVGLAQARLEAIRRNLQINFVQADLARWWLPPERYDLIVVFFFLNRELMPRLSSALRTGGLLFQANRNRHFLKVRPDFSRDYLLAPGELQGLARKAGLEVLYHADRAPNHPHDSHLIAQRLA
jgi:tellurite methyltransferase